MSVMSKTNDTTIAKRNLLPLPIQPEPPAWLPILEKLLTLAGGKNHSRNRRI